MVVKMAKKKIQGNHGKLSTPAMTPGFFLNQQCKCANTEGERRQSGTGEERGTD